jgi:prolyl 4-hydroxylase
MAAVASPPTPGKAEQADVEGVRTQTPFYTIYDRDEWRFAAEAGAIAPGQKPQDQQTQRASASAGRGGGGVRGALQRLMAWGRGGSSTSSTADSAAQQPSQLQRPGTGPGIPQPNNWKHDGTPSNSHRESVPKRKPPVGPSVRIDDGMMNLPAGRRIPLDPREFPRRGHTSNPQSAQQFPTPTPPGFTDFAAPDGHHFVFCVANLLSPGECAFLVDKTNPLMQTVSTQYAQRTRDCDRVLFHSPAMALQLFERLAPHLTPAETEGRVPLCFGQGGVWRPAGVNPVLKVMRYRPGGTFADHRDGPWIPREDQASLFTVLVYLTDAFHGGHTTFYGPQSFGERLKHFAPMIHVTPVTGMAAVFNHDNMHCGTPATGPSQLKHVLRFEVIFERIVPSVPVLMSRFAHTQLESYVGAMAKYAEAHRLCDAGDRAGFMREYQDVLSMQAEASRDALAATVGSAGAAACRLLPRLPGDPCADSLNAECFGEVLLF